jgi:hypothetical protein
VASNPVASAPATPPSAPAVAATAAASRPRGDILEELEKIRSQAKGARAAPTRNGTRRIDQDFSFHLSKDRLHRASRLRVSLRLEDSDQRLVDVFEEGFDVDDPATIEHLLLRLNIALEPRE